MSVYHILNGDALKEQFPEQLAGEIIIARECLVDGPVSSASLDELFAIRAAFIAEAYSGYSVEEYYVGAVSEFNKIKHIPEKARVNLWFEDDLFCQVNCWFTCFLLFHFTKRCSVFIVRPPQHTPYGFGGLSEPELRQAFADRMALTSLKDMAGLWEFYCAGDLEGLLASAGQMEEHFPFVLPAVEAHIARIPTERDKGRPFRTLLEIMEGLATPDFPAVFRAFSQREAIYGFGDLQVKRMYDQLASEGK